VSLVKLLNRVHKIALVIHYLVDLDYLKEILVGLFLLRQRLPAPVILVEGETLSKLIDVTQVRETLLLQIVLGLGRGHFLLRGLFLDLLLLIDKVFEDKEVLKEVGFVAVNGEDLEDRDHLVVALRHHIMEEQSVVVADAPRQGVLLEDLVLKLHYRVNILVVARTVLLSTSLIWVVVDLQDLIYMLMIVVLR